MRVTSGVDLAKQAAAQSAVQLIEEGMTVGLGTGTTAHFFILALGQKVTQGMQVKGVPTSLGVVELARSVGIALSEPGVAQIDIAVDGADAIDPQLDLIKGRHGALVREKIVASCAKRFVIIADDSKLVSQLNGTVPVEILPFGYRITLQHLSQLGVEFWLWVDDKGQPILSDNQNYVAKAEFPLIQDPGKLAVDIEAIPGVVGHGLFLNMAMEALVADAGGQVRKYSR